MVLSQFSKLVGAITGRNEETNAFIPEFLRAAAESIRNQSTLLECLRDELGTDPYGYFFLRSWEKDYRADGVQSRQEGVTADGQWSWFSHGLEIDFENVADGRKLRVEFGPAGRRDAFSGASVALFACTSSPPWGAYPKLAAFLRCAEGEADYERYSALIESGIQQGFVAHADPDLVALRDAYTLTNADGYPEIAIPGDQMPADSNDILTCDRLVLTERARRLAKIRD